MSTDWTFFFFISLFRRPETLSALGRKGIRGRPSARRQASRMRHLRMVCLTSGMWRAATENSRMPRPMRRGIIAGSAAHSPQRMTGLRALIGRGDDHPDEAEDARMGGKIEIGGSGITPIGSEHVLDEIVRSNREKIGLLSKRIAHDGARGNFDHTANRNLFGSFDPLF